MTDQSSQPAPPPPTEYRGPGNPNWYPGMPSPNKSGRPANRPDKRLLATQQMLDEMRAIVAVLCAKALEGDVGAPAIVLSKTMPSIKAQAEKVQFPFDASAPVSRQVEMVLDAISDGHVAPDVGRQIIDAIASLATVRASEDLEARLIVLEDARGL